MKKHLIAAAVAGLFGLAPVVASACDYDAETSAALPSQIAATPAPAATKVPTSTVAKAPVAKTAKTGSKEQVTKVKASPQDAKLNLVSTN
jgi:hypothetical protein